MIDGAVARAERARDEFTVTLGSGEKHTGKRLLLANALRDKLPDIDGITSFWRRSVFVCPFCDGWEFRDRQIAVYGESGDAVDLAQELYGWTTHVTICNRSKAGRVVALELESGERAPCDALFLCIPLRQSCAIAEDLGCKADRSGSIVIDDKCRTNVPGCYAAGDAVTHVHQVILAASSGVRAAIAISTDLICEQADALSHRATVES